jgi:PAS domain S-box-containing protein
MGEGAVIKQQIWLCSFYLPLIILFYTKSSARLKVDSVKNGFSHPGTTYTNQQVNIVANAKHLLAQPLIRKMLQYSLPVVFSALAFAISGIINSVLPGYVRFTFLISIGFATLWGGLGPGLIAAFLASVLIDYYYIPPVGQFFNDTTSFFSLAVFTAIPLLITSIKEARDRSEQVWRDTKFQLEAILQGFTDGILAQDLDGQPVFANEIAARFLGFQSAKLMIDTPVTEMHSWFDAFDEEGNVIRLGAMPRKKAIETGKNHELVVRLSHKTTGEDRWVIFKSAVVFDNQHKPRLTVTILQDISARKKEEVERLNLLLMVEGERRRVQNILDNVPGVVWETKVDSDNRTQNFVFVSDHVKQMLGYNPIEWIEDPDIGLKFTHPDDIPYITEQLIAIYGRDDKSGTMEYRVFHKDGHIVPIEASMSLLLDNDKKPIAIYGVFMDITERKQSEEKLARYALELQRSNEELQRFAYVASHDLQEPLRMIGSYLQLIESRYGDKLDADGHEFIGFAVDGANRMKSLITALLTYSRVETQAQNFVAVDCQHIVDEVKRFLVVTLEESEAVITNDPLPEIVGDERLILALFQNLISNAIKYRSENKLEIHIGAERQKDAWLFSVRDNGIGIESQYLERIFVIFQRLHPRSKYTGMGIGLAICKKVVERHNGHIWAESEIGKGTTFYFTIPA